MKNNGIIQLPLMIGLLIMAVVLPALTTVIKTNKDTRNRATSMYTVYACFKNASSGPQCIPWGTYGDSIDQILARCNSEAIGSDGCAKDYNGCMAICGGGSISPAATPTSPPAPQKYYKCVVANGGCGPTDDPYTSVGACNAKLFTYAKCQQNNWDPECRCYETSLSEIASCNANCKGTGVTITPTPTKAINSPTPVTKRYYKCLLSNKVCSPSENPYTSAQACTANLMTYTKCKTNPSDPECRCYEDSEVGTCNANCAPTATPTPQGCYESGIRYEKETRFCRGTDIVGCQSDGGNPLDVVYRCSSEGARCEGWTCCGSFDRNCCQASQPACNAGLVCDSIKVCRVPTTLTPTQPVVTNTITPTPGSSVNGGWSDWGPCVNGKQTRSCTNPKPSETGAACFGGVNHDGGFDYRDCTGTADATQWTWCDGCSKIWGCEKVKYLTNDKTCDRSSENAVFYVQMGNDINSPKMSKDCSCPSVKDGINDGCGPFGCNTLPTSTPIPEPTGPTATPNPNYGYMPINACDNFTGLWGCVYGKKQSGVAFFQANGTTDETARQACMTSTGCQISMIHTVCGGNSRYICDYGKTGADGLIYYGETEAEARAACQTSCTLPTGSIRCSVCADTKANYSGPDKKGADYDCNGLLSNGDFVVWREEYINKLNNRTQIRYEANGNCYLNPATNFVTSLGDYSLWRQNYIK